MNQILTIVSGIVLLLAIVAVIVIFRLEGRVVNEVTIEAGENVAAKNLVAYGRSIPKITQGLTEEQLRTPGVYSINVSLPPFKHVVFVKVADTVAPQAEPNAIDIYYGGSCAPQDFVKNVSDATAYTCEYVVAPDYSILGEQTVSVLLRDAGKNETIVESVLWYGEIVRSITVEAGGEIPQAAEYIKNYDAMLYHAEYVNVPDEVYGIGDAGSAGLAGDNQTKGTVPGEYELVISVAGREIPVMLQVIDTTAPNFSVTDKVVNGWTIKGIKPEEFIEWESDSSEVTYAYAEEPDWTIEGKNTAVIVATDVYGNVSEAEVSYSLRADKIAPEVEVSEIDAVKGKAISYKKAINYSDNADKKDELTLVVDNSAVILGVEGDYEVIYTVTDSSGNSTSVSGIVHVWETLPEWYDEDEVNRLADEVIAKIIKDGMTQYQKAEAIYQWVRMNVGFIQHSEKGDWVRGAYEGLVLHKGDCFVYASTSKVLLTRAGIQNIDIVKSTVNPMHYWNLVNCGDGWYHFDTTPRYDLAVFFMVTDEELMEYSRKNYDSHIYDASLYPEIK